MNAVAIPIVPAIQLKRILYATDFSEASRRALPIVAAIARRYGSEVYVVNIWSTLPYSMVTPEALAILENKQEQDVKRDMAQLLQTSELQGLRTTALLKSGEPLTRSSVSSGTSTLIWPSSPLTAAQDSGVWFCPGRV